MDITYKRHLTLDHMIDPDKATDRDRFEALAESIRDLLSERWLATERAYDSANPKRVYYISMEYLIGRSLKKNIENLRLEPEIATLIDEEGFDMDRLVEEEPDTGLGNGGLGRLAACYADSMATMRYPAISYGLRYEYGIFRQAIENGYQVEYPDNWLRRPDPWEVRREAETVQVHVNGKLEFNAGVAFLRRDQAGTLLGVPCDRPLVGYGVETINTLRLWEASSPDFFDLNEFNQGDFFGAVHARVAAENLTRVLYPDDSTSAGRELRFFQEFFLVACSLADIVRRFRKSNDDWHALPDKVAIQLNDTHPSMAVAELMRILLDEAHLGWDDAWDLTVRTLAYTNHTLLPEALEKWPVSLFEKALPRHLEIIYEVNRRFLDDVKVRFPGDVDRVRRASLIAEGPEKEVRMAHLAVVGSHSTNGVAAIHSELLRTRTLSDLAEMFPGRFNNKTNGVTPRRWMRQSNPSLSRLITDAIGESWTTDLSELTKLLPLADDASFRASFRNATMGSKHRFADWLKASTGQVVDPQSIFDCQIKRIHEYKRQLLNVLHIVILYNRLLANPNLDVPPRTFFFAGKAAPAYLLAKLIIKLINSVAQTIDSHPTTAGRLKVVFLADYGVSLAERLIPASDVSEQISTAGYEASGTSNMKLMMNGALTVGTRDGATIEMAQEAGEENFFLFGLTADEVAGSRGWYDPHWHYDHEPETRGALDLIASNHFNPSEPGIFDPILDRILKQGDFYMLLADMASYSAIQSKVGELYRDQEGWARKAIINVACSGKFSSDRAVKEYATQIWGAEPCPVSPSS